MYKLRPFVKTNILLNVYYSIIHPHLIYGIQVWGSSFDTNLNKLEILQKKVVRLITHNDNFYNSGELPHSQALFYELKLLKIKDIFKLQISKFIHDCIHFTPSSQFASWFLYIENIHGHDTRRKRNLFSPYARTTHYGLKYVKVEGVKIWNNIPENISKMENRKVFCKSLKESLIMAYLNS